MGEETYIKWSNEQNYIKSLIKESDDLSFDPLLLNDLKLIGGVDLSFVKSHKNIAVSYLCVMTFPDFKVVYEDYEFVELDVEYIPGFLAFRECFHLAKLYNKLKKNHSELLP